MVKLAGHTMTATLILFTFTLAADPVPKVAPEPLPPEPKRDPTNVRELYDAYRYYGLPLPPKGSYLVKHTVVSGFPVERNGKTETRYLTADELVLITDTRSKKQYLSPSDVEPGPELFRNDFLTLDNGFYYREHQNWIAFAAQSHSLGCNDVAKLSFEKGLALGDYDTADGKNPILDWLKDAARNHHEQQLEKPRANRREILKALNRAMRSPEHTYFSFGKNLIENLNRTIRIDWNRPEKADAIIDGIVRGTKSVDDLLAFGFDAIPVLIRHIDDDRLTRATILPRSDSGCMHFSNVRVGQMCKDLLINIVELKSTRVWKYRDVENDDARQGIDCFIRQEALDWYHRVKLKDERKWLVDELTIHRTGNRSTCRDDILLSVIRQKYPEELPRIFNHFITIKLKNSAILSAIATSQLSKDLKRELFREAVWHPDLWNYLDITGRAFLIERNFGVEYLRKHLAKSIRTKTLTFPDESNFDELTLVRDADDPECWSLYRRFFFLHDHYRRSLLIIACFDDDETPTGKSTWRERVLCMLSQFDDTKILSNTEPGIKPQYATSNFGYWELPIRDFAALRLAAELELDIPWKKDRTAAEWATIREKVRVAAEKAIEHSK